MQKLKLLLISLLFCNVALANEPQNNTNDSRTPPKPVENKVYDAMVGTWEGDTDMMGKKMHDVLKIRWGLNHQFIIMELKATSKNNPKMTYEGLGIFGLDAEGKPKTFWFDSWGANSVSTGAGEFSDNRLEIKDSNPKFSEVRTLDIKGKEMIMHAKGTATWEGKETPFEVTTKYKKK